MPAKVKSATALAKEAAEAAAAANTNEESFEDAVDDVEVGISKDLLAYMRMQEKVRKEEMIRQDNLSISVWYRSNNAFYVIHP